MTRPAWQQVQHPFPAYLLRDDTGIIGSVRLDAVGDRVRYIPYGKGSEAIGAAYTELSHAKTRVERHAIGYYLNPIDASWRATGVNAWELVDDETPATVYATVHYRDGRFYALTPDDQQIDPAGFRTDDEARRAARTWANGAAPTPPPTPVIAVETAPTYDTLCASRGRHNSMCQTFATFRVLRDGETFGDACPVCVADTLDGALSDNGSPA